ncbi:MAG TPA: ATP-binding protein [Mucilaginibacter sp.]|jgi:signal transduction histidine kinase|nr:ATP-binding protein [Mucilaginibacter sp.]
MLFFKAQSFLYSSGKTAQSRLPAILILACAIQLLTFSCNKPAETPGSNNQYNKVLDSANHLYDAGKYAEAIGYINSVTGDYKDLPLSQKFEYYAFNYNYLFHRQGDSGHAMLYADSMLNLFDTPEIKSKEVSRYGQAFFFKGDVLFSEKKYNEAYRYFYQGKLTASKDINDCALSDYSYHMGMIMYKQEHYRLAAENFKNSSKESNSCNLTFRSFYRRQELLNNTGLCYGKINEPDSALAYFKKALNYIDLNIGKFKVRDEALDVARGVIYGNEANIYISQSKFTLAKKLLKQSSSINLKKGNDNLDAQLSELKLAHIYYQLNQPDSLISLLGSIRGQLDSVKNQDGEADWNLLMAKYFNQNKQPQQALNYFTRYDALKDSINSRIKMLKEADIGEQIKRIEQDYAFNKLTQDNRVQHLYLNIALVFGLMFLVIISMVLLNWRKSRKNIKLLGGLNYQINQQNTDLEKALNELKSNGQEKDRILRAVAHDLRNPIGGIVSLTQLIDEEECTEDQRETIDLIRETSLNSLELINELLEVTNDGTKLTKKENVEINSLLSHSIELMRFKAAEKNQQIKLTLLDKPLDLFISREKIWRVMSNLISNAIKFSPEKTVIYVKIMARKNDVEISVKDNGVGIPDKVKDKVFNMFTEAKRPGTAGEKSFGLGLSICKQIVEDHNGKIWFESNGESGTTFYVSLPKADG